MGNLKSFKSFTESRVNEVITTFGHFQPPHIGHEVIFQRMIKESQGKKYAIFTSQANDADLNPLTYEGKIRFLRKIFPKLGRNIIEDKNVNSILDVAIKLNEQGYTKLTLVCCKDQAEKFERTLSTNNGTTYEFKDGINVIGVDKPDLDSAALRDAAKHNDLETFAKGIPRSFGAVRELFNGVRIGMGLKESHSFRKHISLDSVSDVREAYIQGQLFAVNDNVSIVGTELTGIVSKCGPNYIIVEASDGKSYRKWLNAVQKI